MSLLMITVPALEIIPPVAYSTLWLVLAAGLVLAVVGWAVVVLIRTRAPRRPSPAVVAGPDLRADYLHRIAVIRRDAAVGAVSPRLAHQRLSVTVREFIRAVTGAPVDTMTLAQLRELSGVTPGGPGGRAAGPGLAELTDYVDRLYPPEFGPDPQPSPTVDAAADQAEELVRRWP